MAAILHAGLTSAVWAAVLALAAAIGARVWRSRPAVVHALWLIVLLKLVTPSLLEFEIPSAVVSTLDAKSPALAFESRSPVPAAKPPIDVASRVAESVAPSDEHPRQDSPERAVEISVKPSRPPAAQASTPWAAVGKMAMPGVLVVWLVGAIVCWTVVGLYSARFRRLIRSARLVPVGLRQRIARIAQRLELRGIPVAYTVPARVPPMVWVPLAGSPHLVLPEELWGRLDAAQQDAVLAHELAHLKRRDHWVRRLETLACGLYWWNPVAWWARREVERAEERCCDAWVLWALPAAAEAYADALVMTAVYLSGLRRPLPSGASGAERLHPLKRRLHMILSDATSVSVVRTAPRALLILGALSLPFLPAFASGGGRDERTPPQVKSEDHPAKPITIAPEQDQKEGAATAHLDQKKDSPPPERVIGNVTITQAVVRDIVDYQTYTGTIVAGRHVELRARVSGMLVKVNCHPGQTVAQDERLFSIDERPYRAELDRAEAELEGAQARRTRWSKELERAKHLVNQQSISQEEVNRVESDAAEAEASVKVARIARDLAKLKYEFTEVRAPIAGTIIGSVLSEGNVAAADTTPLAKIISTDPVLVEFDVDQKTLVHFNRLRREGKIKGGSLVGLPITVVLGDEALPLRGKIDSVDLQINTASGTSRWRGTIPNPDGILLPGMAVLVRPATSETHKTVLVPESAVMQARDRQLVFVLTDQNTFQFRSVKAGNVYDGLRSVEGLKPDEWVVTRPSERSFVDGEKAVREKLPEAKSSP
jgi:RND family efflux transporter MFP subunit